MRGPRIVLGDIAQPEGVRPSAFWSHLFRVLWVSFRWHLLESTCDTSSDSIGRAGLQAASGTE